MKTTTREQIERITEAELNAIAPLPDRLHALQIRLWAEIACQLADMNEALRQIRSSPFPLSSELSNKAKAIINSLP